MTCRCLETTKQFPRSLFLHKPDGRGKFNGGNEIPPDNCPRKIPSASPPPLGGERDGNTEYRKAAVILEDVLGEAAIGDRHASRIRGKVMIEHLDGLTTPLPAGLVEETDEFPALRIDTDHRYLLPDVSAYLASYVSKLLVALPGIGGGAQARLLAFEVHAKRKVHFLEQSSNGF